MYILYNEKSNLLNLNIYCIYKQTKTELPNITQQN